MEDFVGAGSPMSQSGLDAATAIDGIDSANLWAVLSVETSGCGFLADRRPKILFERHIFSGLTAGAYDASNPDISSPTPGGYGPGGSNQYARLQAAMELNQEAALKSASWGLGQIMGENYSPAGFSDVDSMVSAMVSSEDAQLQAMAAFISAQGMAQALQNQDWAGFARLYNGPNYAANNYDGLLRQFYAQISNGKMPDLTVRAAQVYLTYRGFDLGNIDGIAGPNTVAAVKSFQASIGVPVTGLINPQLIQALPSSSSP